MVGSFAGIGTIKDSSYANDPLNGDPVCLKLGLGAPQRDEDAHDGQPSVTKSINEWCAEVDGNSVTKSNTTIFQYYPTGNDRYWLSAEYWFQSTDSSCGGNTRKVTKDECQKTLITSMQECDPESKTSHGASLVGQCIKYVSQNFCDLMSRANVTLHRISPSHRTTPTSDLRGSRFRRMLRQSAKKDIA